MARTERIAAPRNAPVAVTQRPGYALKTEGTNMAFRRDVLTDVGGFDPAYRFYLDETDLNLRLAAAGRSAVLVPLAEVHHGFAPSDRRRADRVPLDLSEVGASLAVFLRRHSGAADPGRLEKEVTERHRSLVAHMVAGRIEPRDIGRILRTLQDGWQTGLARSLTPLQPLTGDPPPFLPFATIPGGHRIIAGHRRDAARLRADAAAAVAAGDRVSLYLLSTSARYHRIGFDDAGYWVQSGGLFGRSERGDRLFRRWSRDARVRREADRLRGRRVP